MRTLHNAETAVRDLLGEKINKGQMTPQDAERLYRWGFRIALTTIGNFRHRRLSDETIEETIRRKKLVARTALAHAATINAKNLAARELILAEMFGAVWTGMQQDVRAYQDH